MLLTGSISGLVGIDSLALTGVELGIDNVDDAVQKSIEISKAAAAEGAIITLSTHMPNMSNEKIIATPDAARKYDFSQCDFSEAMRSLQPILISLQITQTDLAIFLFYSVHSMKIQADGSGGVLRQPIKRHTVRCSSTHRIIWHQREYTTLFMYIPQMVR